MYYPQHPMPPYGAPYYPPRQVDPLREYRRGLRKTANRLSWMILAGLYLMALLYQLLPELVWAIGYPQIDPNFDGLSQEMYYLIACLYYAVGMFAPFFLFLLASHRSFNQSIPFQKVRPRIFLCCIFLGLAVCLLANYPANIVASLIEASGYTAFPAQTPLPDSPVGIALYAVSVAVVPALVEEFAFRGVILSRLQPYGNGFAVVASALLFGFYHGNFVQLPFAFLCGLIFGFIMVRTRNLFLPILVHALNNGLSVTLELIQANDGEALTETVYMIIFLSVIFLAVLSVILLAVKEKGFFQPSSAHHPIRLSTRFGALFSNPGAIVFLLFTLYSSILMMVPLS